MMRTTRYTRKLAKENIFAGNSCGAAIKGVIQLNILKRRRCCCPIT